MKLYHVAMSIVALVAIGSVGYGWIHASTMNHSLRTQSQASTHTIRQRTRAIQDKDKLIDEQFQKGRSTNPDPNISSVFLQNDESHQVGNDITKLFDTYYNFSSGDEYSERGQQLLKQGLITKHLAQDKQLFGSDKVASGDHYVDQLGLNSNFSHAYSFLPTLDPRNHTLDVSALVEYTSNFQGQPGQTNTVAYRLTYDLNDHRVTDMQKGSYLFDNLNALHDLQNGEMINDY